MDNLVDDFIAFDFPNFARNWLSYKITSETYTAEIKSLHKQLDELKTIVGYEKTMDIIKSHIYADEMGDIIVHRSQVDGPSKII